MKVDFVKELANAKLPEYMTPGAAGADIYSAEELTINPGRWRLIDTGLACRIPEGYEIQVRPRSGLALKQGITVLNSPGTIDSDYTGRLKVMLINHSQQEVTIVAGDRIAQIVVAPVIQAQFNWTTEHKETSRDSAGFGSTGV